MVYTKNHNKVSIFEREIGYSMNKIMWLESKQTLVIRAPLESRGRRGRQGYLVAYVLGTIII